MSTIPPELERIARAGLPPAVLGFWAWLYAHGGACNTAEAAQALGVDKKTIWRYARDLEAIGSLVRRGAGPSTVCVLLHGQKNVTVKRNKDGRWQRCQVCAVVVKAMEVGGTGVYCPTHKQTHARADSAWWVPAEKLLRKGLSPIAVTAKLGRQGVRAPLCDYLIDGREKRMPGLITRARRAGLLGDEWDEYHRNLSAGEDADG
jgi:hypothetical protein